MASSSSFSTSRFARFSLPPPAPRFDEKKPQISTPGVLELYFEDYEDELDAQKQELEAQKRWLDKPELFPRFSGLEARVEKLKAHLFFRRPIDPKTGKPCEIGFFQRKGAFCYEEVFCRSFHSIARCKISLMQEAKGDEILLYVLENINDLKMALNNLRVSQKRVDKRFTGFFGALASSCKTLEQLHVNDLSQTVMEQEKLQIETVCKVVEKALSKSNKGLLAKKALSRSDNELSVEKVLSRSHNGLLTRRALSRSDNELSVDKPLSRSDDNLSVKEALSKSYNGLLENSDVIISHFENTGALVRAKSRYLSNEKVGGVECPYLFQEKTFSYIKNGSNFSEAKELAQFYDSYLGLLKAHQVYFTEMISSHLLLKNEAERIIEVIDQELCLTLEGEGSSLERDAGESSWSNCQEE